MYVANEGFCFLSELIGQFVRELRKKLFQFFTDWSRSLFVLLSDFKNGFPQYIVSFRQGCVT